MEADRESGDYKSVTINMTISRDGIQEIEVDFDKIKDYHVLDAEGNKIRFGDIYSQKKTIVVFVRQFLCFMCEEYVEDLAKVPEDVLQEADVQVVIIGCARPKYIEPFCKRTSYKYQIYVDPDRQLYEKMKCLPKPTSMPKRGSKHVKSGNFMGIMKSTWRAMNSPPEFQGNPAQQGGSFVLGPGDICHFSHADKNGLDHTNINDLLQAAGVNPVSFPLDQRVFTI